MTSLSTSGAMGYPVLSVPTALAGIAASRLAHYAYSRYRGNRTAVLRSAPTRKRFNRIMARDSILKNPSRPGRAYDLKYHDSHHDTSFLQATADCSSWEKDPAATEECLNAPPCGTSAVARSGLSIVIRSVRVRGYIDWPAESDANDQRAPGMALVMLVLDTQTNSAQMSSENMLTNDSGDTLLSTSAMLKLSVLSRYKVLRTWKCVKRQQTAFTDGANTASVSGDLHVFDLYVPCNIVVNFGAYDGSKISEIVDNSLHIIAGTNSFSGTPEIQYNARIRFFDGG